MGWESTFSKLDSLPESMTLHVGVKSPIQYIHFLIKITGFFMHARLDQLRSDPIELIVRDLHIVGRDTIGSFGG